MDSITFHELLDAVHTDTIIIKIDIEGAECNVSKLYSCTLQAVGMKSLYYMYINKLATIA